MLNIPCDKCGDTLKEFGGNLYGPPLDGLSQKYHVCYRCWRFIIEWMGGRSKLIVENPKAVGNEYCTGVDATGDKGRLLTCGRRLPCPRH